VSRTFALLFVAALTAPAAGQMPPVLATAKVEKGKLLLTRTETVLVPKEVSVEVIVNGKTVVEKRVVTELQTVQSVVAIPLKELKATDAAGEPIAAEKLTELLKDETPVVVATGEVPEKFRRLFRRDVVFIILPAVPTGKEPPARPLPPKP
jgi:hypothetical protein